jgi:hypothetical protein
LIYFECRFIRNLAQRREQTLFDPPINVNGVPQIAHIGGSKRSKKLGKANQRWLAIISFGSPTSDAFVFVLLAEGDLPDDPFESEKV